MARIPNQRSFTRDLLCGTLRERLVERLVEAHRVRALAKAVPDVRASTAPSAVQEHGRRPVSCWIVGTRSSEDALWNVRENHVHVKASRKPDAHISGTGDRVSRRRAFA